VVKHAGTGASCVVGVSYTDADLVIRVTDDGGPAAGLPVDDVATAGAGHGLIGMRERVHLCGGAFSAGQLTDRGFQVMAALPLPAASLVAERGPRRAEGQRAEGAAAEAEAADSLAAVESR